MIKRFFETELAKLKTMTVKAKVGYIYEYYKWWFIGFIIIVVSVTSLTITILKQPDETVMAIPFVNAYTSNGISALKEEYVEYAKIDGKLTGVSFESSYYFDLNNEYVSDNIEYQNFIARLAASHFDVVVADIATIDKLMDMGAMFLQVDSEEYYSYFQPYSNYFVEYTLTDSETGAEKTGCYAIDISSCPEIAEDYENGAYLTIVMKEDHFDYVLKLLECLLN